MNHRAAVVIWGQTAQQQAFCPECPYRAIHMVHTEYAEIVEMYSCRLAESNACECPGVQAREER